MLSLNQLLSSTATADAASESLTLTRQIATLACRRNPITVIVAGPHFCVANDYDRAGHPRILNGS